MFLHDTVVLSELRKAPRERNGNLVHWIGRVTSQDLYLSVVTIGEIERGIERQRQVNPPFADGMLLPRASHFVQPGTTTSAPSIA
jgi:predicted nucleic acid-binding protein